MRTAAVVVLLAACTSGLPEVGAGSDAAGRVEVVLGALQPGWRVTTSRLGAGGTTEATIVADGSPITLVGAADDVFDATVTDAAGALLAHHAMAAPCTLASPDRLDVPGDYPTIQAAIDAADAGDTVRVAAGTYSESLRLKAGVCLLGAGPRRTILDAHGEARTLIDLSDAPGSAVVGFTIRGTRHPYGGCTTDSVFDCSGNWYRAGIYLGGSQWRDATRDAPPLIADNVIADNQMGVMLYWHGVAIVRNNVFVDNTTAFIANHYDSEHTLIANNVFVDNRALAIANQAAFLDIIDNVIVGSAIGIEFMSVQTGAIRCNIFHGNGANSVDTDHGDGARFNYTTDRNLDVEPRFVGNGDFHLHPDSPGRDAGCHGDQAREPDGSPPDIGAYGGPLAASVEL